ncbi:MAG TPA: Na+/H+ antiporter subunit E [Devosiaceae bacterium]|jgi:multicomponent Na+:H+ antiporter subunit E|nr:Na+/H+ antiporter subunit E [Devosiaceae bacterium]
MNAPLLILVLGLGWIAVTGGFTLANLFLGAVIAALVIYLLRHRLKRPLGLWRAWQVLALAGLFVRELLLSAVGVAALVLSPELERRLRPAIIAFPLSARSDEEITLLANLITLTPGTLSLDVSADRKWLFVHVLSLSTKDQLISEIANGFEKKVIEVFR